MTAQTYEAWRISYQSSEQAARAAFARAQELEAQVHRAAEDERAAILLRVKDRAVAGALLVDDFRQIVADRGTPQEAHA